MALPLSAASPAPTYTEKPPLTARCGTRTGAAAEQEKLDKEALQMEVANLRENNQRLQIESHSASEQLKKFAKIISGTEKKDH